jgi:hypothetical protein
MQQDMTCSKDMGMQHGNGMPHILGHAVWARISSMDIDCSIDKACSMEMDMQQVLDMNVFMSMSMSTVAMGTAQSPGPKKFFSSHLV